MCIKCQTLCFFSPEYVHQASTIAENSCSLDGVDKKVDLLGSKHEEVVEEKEVDSISLTKRSHWKRALLTPP